MRSFLQGRIRLVRRLLADPEVAYADLGLILTAVLSACASSRWPGTGIDRSRFVELLVRASPLKLRAGFISVPALLSSGLITEAQTPWARPGEWTRVYRGDEIDCDLDSAARSYPAVSKKDLKRHSYACLIYEWLRCGYAHEYCASAWTTSVPPSRETTEVSYIGRLTSSGIIRILSFHLEYLIELAAYHVSVLPDHPTSRPTKWWLDIE